MLTPQNKNEVKKAALCYLWIFSVMIYFSERENSFINYHAKRGMILFFLSIVLWLIPFLRWTELIIFFIALINFIQVNKIAIDS